MSADYDVVVIGAGPAGMTAAARADEGGARVLLVDDQAAPGGQIYRAVEGAGRSARAYLGEEYLAGQTIAARFRESGAEYRSSAVVWQVTADGEVGLSHDGQAQLIKAGWVILATGAVERPFPVRGWTLPGVMTAGAAQTLLKTSGVAADGAMFAGTGPLLYLVVAQYIRAGVKVAALIDTTDKANRSRALRHLPAALSRWDLLSKGQLWLREIRRSGTTVIDGVSDLRVVGDDSARGLAYRTPSADWRAIEGRHVFLHQGVVPNVNLSMSTGMAHDWDEGQLCWRPRVDEWGCSELPGIAIAGDGAGIDGAVAAQAAGELTALNVLYRLGRCTQGERDSAAQSPQRILRRERRIRPFLDQWFRPADHFRVPPESETIVCRCEELTVGDLSKSIGIGVAGPNQLKSYSRAGMGPCQGRMCGLTVQEMIAEQTSRSPADVGYYRLRPPIKPLRLEELADLDVGEADAGT